ncbi:hypothetical protein [Pseudorhodobacter sp.]|nr:hypothetical protein [Pseudorhodobacter sp.]
MAVNPRHQTRQGPKPLHEYSLDAVEKTVFETRQRSGIDQQKLQG